MADNFRATVSLENGQAAVLQMHGEINGLADVVLDSAFDEAEGLSPVKYVLDFSEVDYINSTGIALIVGLLARARTYHRPVVAVGLSDHYREIFNITRLSDFMEIK